jgi:hypothetical protein
MQTILQVTLDDEEEARVLQTLLIEMGYPTYRFAKQPTAVTPVAETRLGRLMLGMMRERPGQLYHSSDFSDLLIDHGYKPSSAPPILSALVVAGDVERVDRALYQLKEQADEKLPSAAA